MFAPSPTWRWVIRKPPKGSPNTGRAPGCGEPWGLGRAYTRSSPTSGHRSLGLARPARRLPRGNDLTPRHLGPADRTQISLFTRMSPKGGYKGGKNGDPITGKLTRYICLCFFSSFLAAGIQRRKQECKTCEGEALLTNRVVQWPKD